MIRILIADDHAIFRKGLRQTIEDNSDMRVVDEASTGARVLSLVNKKSYDVAILDISMPGLSGLETLVQLKGNYPSLPVIVLSMHSEEQYALRVMKAGAAAYLTKEIDETILAKAIRKASSGGKFITPSLAEKMAFAIETDHKQAPHEGLSDREFQIMRKIAEGKSVGAIADELSLSVSTISTYRARVLEKTGLKNNAEITHYIIKNSLIE